MKWTDVFNPPKFQPAHTRLSPDDASVVVLAVPELPMYLDEVLRSLGLVSHQLHLTGPALTPGTSTLKRGLLSSRKVVNVGTLA